MKKLIKENELDICEDIYCKCCGTLVSKTTKSCPNCGKQIKGAIKKLDSHEVAQCYEGKPIDFEKLLKVFTENGDDGEEYIAYCIEFDEDQCSLFNITPTIYDYWEFYGIEFSIYLDIKNETVFNCEISKFRETGGYHGRPQTHVLTPTQQEIRIFRRIMDYIITQ